MHRTDVLAAALLALTLSACSSFTGGPADAPARRSLLPDNVRLTHAFTGTGVQTFVCQRDREGYYWKHLGPKVDLTDSAGRLRVRQNAQQNFVAKDGSRVTVRILAHAPADRTENLPDVLYAATPASTKGLLKPVQYILRDRAVGGVPLTVCSASQAGLQLKIRFRARYRLYRQKD